MTERAVWIAGEVTDYLILTDWPPKQAAAEGVLCADYVNRCYADWRDNFGGTLPDWWDNRRDGALWRRALYETVRNFFYDA